MNLLGENFLQDLCFGHISWPPKSADLNSMDFSLCSNLKESVYSDNPPTACSFKGKCSLMPIEPNLQGSIVLIKLGVNYEVFYLSLVSTV